MLPAEKHPLQEMNRLGASRTPFLFIIDYEMKQPLIMELGKVNPDEILYDINGFSNVSQSNRESGDPSLTGSPARKQLSRDSLIRHAVSYDDYLRRFNRVQVGLQAGNSYLLNLTQPTEIDNSLSLFQIFNRAKAPYRLWMKEKLTLFSPECFVRIQGERISSYPMKGTLNADIPNAREVLLANEKEKAEHITIVDLIRNDLNRVASDVHVERFRYIDRIETAEGALLQVSSEISGLLDKDYHSHLGDIFYSLLPAGSITGAPKKKTLEMIRDAEEYDRGYYTGIFGYYDGCSLESAVMIRFIDRREKRLFYKSGGGITVYSSPVEEYRELLEKVYLPPGC